MKSRSGIVFEHGLERPYQKSKPIKIVDTKLDKISSDEVIVQIKASGLCHSDLAVISGKRPRKLPIALGHEAAGIIIEKGEDVTEFDVGDHVICSFVPSCGKCDYCKQGMPSQCQLGNKAGQEGTLLSGKRKINYENEYIYHHSGVSAFSEYSVLSKHSLVKIDKDIPFEVAAIFGCAVITGVGSVLNTAKIETGSTVGIIGLGGVGLSALLGAKVAGAREIVVFDINDEKLKFAEELGATHVCNVNNEEQLEIVKDEFFQSLDYTFETAGSNQTFDFIYEFTKPRGTLVTTSLPHPENKINISHFNLTFQEKTLKGSYIGGSIFSIDIPKYLDLYRQGILPVDKLISHTIKFEDINRGFDLLADGEAMRVVIIFD